MQVRYPRPLGHPIFLMKLRNILKQLRRSRGFTLIELAIVGLFLGLLAVFAITAFSSSATDTTRANGLYEAASKLSDNWALLLQSCAVSSDITATAMSAGTAGTTAGKNLSLLVGNVGALATYQACVNMAGVRPLAGLTTGGQGAEAIQGYTVTLGNTTGATGRNAVTVSLANVPESVILPLYNRYSSIAGASSATTLPVAADTTDPQIRFSTATAGKRTLTIVRPL